MPRTSPRLYGVPTKRLNEQYRRHIDRFREDFAFQLAPEEWAASRSQIATASKRNIRYLPVVFTEHGALMAANILNRPRAVATSVYVIRAFARLRSGSGASWVFCIQHSTFFIPLSCLHSLPNPKLASMSKKTPSVTLSGRRTE
jgi:hypothetical protein